NEFVATVTQSTPTVVVGVSLATTQPNAHTWSAAQTFNGNVAISKASPVVVISDTGAGSDAGTLAFISFQRSGVEKAWVGFGDGTAGRVRILNNIGDIYIAASSTVVLTGGILVVGTVPGTPLGLTGA